MAKRNFICVLCPSVRVRAPRFRFEKFKEVLLPVSIPSPSLYQSDFFERNRASYYDALMRVRLSHDLIHWVRFFLNGVAETAQKGRGTYQKIFSLRGEMERQVRTLGRRAPNALEALHFLYRKHVIQAADLEVALQVTTPTANAVISDLRGLEILSG